MAPLNANKTTPVTVVKDDYTTFKNADGTEGIYHTEKFSDHSERTYQLVKDHGKWTKSFVSGVDSNKNHIGVDNLGNWVYTSGPKNGEIVPGKDYQTLHKIQQHYDNIQTDMANAAGRNNQPLVTKNHQGKVVGPQGNRTDSLIVNGNGEIIRRVQIADKGGCHAWTQSLGKAIPEHLATQDLPDGQKATHVRYLINGGEPENVAQARPYQQGQFSIQIDIQDTNGKKKSVLVHGAPSEDHIDFTNGRNQNVPIYAALGYASNSLKVDRITNPDGTSIENQDEAFNRQVTQKLLDIGFHDAKIQGKPYDAKTLATPLPISKVATVKPPAHFQPNPEKDKALLEATDSDSPNLEKIKKLLDEGANVNATNKYNDTPLYIAIDNNQTELANLLINHGASVNQKCSMGDTPLHIAAYRGNAKLMQLLIDHGANTKAINISGETLLHGAVWNGNTAAMDLALQKVGNIEVKDNSGDTPLLTAARASESGAMKFLLAHGANPNTTSRSGETLLHRAAEYGSIGTTELALQKIGNIEVTDDNGNTPLLAATRTGNIKTVKFLLDKGANPNVVNKSGETLLHNAAFSATPELVDLALEKGGDVNVTDASGNTALLRATGAYSSDEKVATVVKTILEKGGSVNVKNKFLRTPLLNAAEFAPRSVTELLLKNNADITAKDSRGDTALHIAVYWGNLEAIKALFAHQADVTVKNDVGQTPLQVTPIDHKEEVAKLLEELTKKKP